MITIYVAGSLPKGDVEGKSYVNWRLEYYKHLEKAFPKVKFIDPYRADKDENDTKSVFGEDCMHIKGSDLIVVNGESKLGAGTAMELVIAKYFKKPVVIVLPKDSHHRRSNLYFAGVLVKDWVHPFIDSMVDYVIGDISEIVKIKNKVFKGKIKDIRFIDEAIEHAKCLGVS